MFSFFKKKEPESPPKEKWSQSTGFGSPDGGTALGHNAPKPLKFHPTLVSQLKKDHSDLLGLFGQINTMGEARDWKGVAEKQLMFRGRLTDHLLVEAVKLYREPLQKSTYPVVQTL